MQMAKSFRSFGPYGYGMLLYSAELAPSTSLVTAVQLTPSLSAGPFMGTFGVNTNDRAAREMMKAFEEVMRSSSSCQPSQQSATQNGGDVRLNIDAVETDDAYTYWADVPGLEKSDLKVCLCCCSACIYLPVTL